MHLPKHDFGTESWRALVGPGARQPSARGAVSPKRPHPLQSFHPHSPILCSGGGAVAVARCGNIPHAPRCKLCACGQRGKGMVNCGQTSPNIVFFSSPGLEYLLKNEIMQGSLFSADSSLLATSVEGKVRRAWDVATQTCAGRAATGWSAAAPNGRAVLNRAGMPVVWGVEGIKPRRDDTGERAAFGEDSEVVVL